MSSKRLLDRLATQFLVKHGCTPDGRNKADVKSTQTSFERKICLTPTGGSTKYRIQSRHR